MLAAWLRMKFPNVVDGTISSSGPILYFKGFIYNLLYSLIRLNTRRKLL